MSQQLVVTGTPQVGATLTTNAAPGVTVTWHRDGTGSAWCGEIARGPSYVCAPADTHVKGLRAHADDLVGPGGVSDLFGPIKATPVPPPPPPPVPVVPLGYARVGIASAAQVAAIASENIIVAEAWSVAAEKAANPQAQVGMYFNIAAMTTGPITNGLYPAVPYNAAYSLGTPISGYSTLIMAALDHPDYQDAWATLAIKQAHATGADFVFADNCDTIPSGPQSRYSGNTGYQTAMQAMLTAVTPQLHAAGVKVIPNIGSASSFPTVAIQWGTVVDGFMDEQFGKWGTTVGSGYRGMGSVNPPSGALGQVAEVAAMAAAGKQMILVTHAADGDTQAANYGACLALLGSSGTNITYCASEPPEYASWTLPPDSPQIPVLGQPQGAYTLNGTVAIRQFAGGTVTVDFSKYTGTITLNTGEDR